MCQSNPRNGNLQIVLDMLCLQTIPYLKKKEQQEQDSLKSVKYYPQPQSCKERTGTVILLLFSNKPLVKG